MSRRTVALREVGQIVGGGTPSTNHPEYFGNDYPWITPRDLSRQGTRFVEAGERGISQAGLAASSAKLLPAGTVVISSRAPIGLTALASVPVTTNQGCRSFVPGNDADSLFMYYLLGSLSDEFERRANGSTFKEISGSALGAFEIDLPDLVEQKAIAMALGALDDKIESNRRTMGILEKLGAALIEQAFTLDPFGNPEYDDSRRLGDVLSLLETGSRPKGGLQEGVEGVVSLGAQHVQSAGVCARTDFGHVPHEFAESMTRGRLEEGDVLIYKDGGKPGNFIPHVSAFGYGFPVDRAVINEHVYRARAGQGVSQGLLYWLLRSPWMDLEMRKRGTGVAIPSLNSTNVRNLPTPAGLSSKASGLSEKLEPMLAALLRLGTENRRLANIRDALLPELLSGRIGVSQAGEAFS
ncbi:type I restriction endonuclease MjaXP subunit S [Cellulomonas algicola]|uniref:Type I restriction endonuclease MjaXP subunit S n=1 Tax=Cellulomonas algicola TaxID=2071633 RepID=A0A401V0Y6_9CELL|nr:restriction endonuclease subunit S [Cellulomonas algicola]GCD20568.1 type I restriction endonuclease MjaXP subunit S [Cellulomonas algicola]